jgi:hypothetical protein
VILIAGARGERRNFIHAPASLVVVELMRVLLTPRPVTATRRRIGWARRIAAEHDAPAAALDLRIGPRDRGK